MTFPSFITTGPTRDITVQPLEYKPFNLLPLIQMLHEDGKKASTSAASSKATTDDTKLEGRIGGVNQIMAEVNKQDNIIKSGISLYGDAFTGTPEYARAVRNREFAMNPEVINTLARETKNVDLFKDQIKGKGTFFHLGQFASTGELKRAKQWQDILEYGKSNDYYGYVNGEYKGDFDWTPQFNTMSDVAVELEKLFKVGYMQTEQGWTDVANKIVGDTVGVSTAYKTFRSKRNFQQLEDGPKMQLEEARDQALSRTLADGFDFTDPLVNGYFQSFLQKAAGQGDDPFREYKDKKGDVTEENFERFLKDFQTFVSTDIQSWYQKRKEEETGSTSKEDFVVDEEGTRALAAKKEAELAAQAWTSVNESHGDVSDFGMEAKWFEGGNGLAGLFPNLFREMLGTGSGLEELGDTEKGYLYAEPWSPFYKQSIDGKTYYNLNEDRDWETIKENILKEAVKNNVENPEKYANNLITLAKEAEKRFEQAKKDGKTYKTTGRYETDAQYMGALQIPQWFVDGANRKDLIGQKTEEMGVNSFAKIGDTHIMLNDVKGLQYAGIEGGIKMTANTVPTNLFTRVIENGQVMVYQWASPAWKKLTNEKKQAIIDLAQQQAKDNPMYGTMLLNGAGQLDNTIKKDYAAPMDEFSQKALAALVNDPNSSLNMVFASPGAYTASGKFKAKTEKEIAQAFKDINIYVEIPENYMNNEKEKKEYYATRQKIRSRAFEIVKKGPKDFWGNETITLNDALVQASKELLKPNQKAEFEEKEKEFKKWQEKKIREDKNYSSRKNKQFDDYQDFAADYFTGKKLNYQNKKTQLSSVPVSTDGYTLTDDAKKQLNLIQYTEGTGKDAEKGYQVNIEFDATGITLRNVSDPKLQRDARTWHIASQLRYLQGRGWIIEEKKNDKYSGVKPK